MENAERINRIVPSVAVSFAFIAVFISSATSDEMEFNAAVALDDNLAFGRRSGGANESDPPMERAKLQKRR